MSNHSSALRGARANLRSERRFYAAMTLAIFATVYVGFARSFFLRPWFTEVPVPPEPYFLWHGLVFTAWFLILLAQPLLVSAGRIDRHRALGKLGAVVAVALLATGIYGSLLAAGRPGGFLDVPVPPLQFLAVPLFDMLVFAAFVTLALRAVRDPQAHKRWMLLASIALLGAALARWPGQPLSIGGPPLLFALVDLFLLPLVAWDIHSRGRLHPVTIAGGLALILSQPLRLAISGTAAWSALTAALVALVR